MVSTSTKFDLNKRILTENPNKAFDKKTRFYQPGKLLPLLGTRKIEENWFTPNLNNAFHQQEKESWNKSTQFEINPKSVYTSRNEGFDENLVTTSLKKLLSLAGISTKIQENDFYE